LIDVNEYKIGTNPKAKDTDSDGIPDGNEDKNRNGKIDTGETNPAKADTDGDRFSNIKEYQKNTDPDDPKSHPPRSMPWLPLLLGD